MVAEALELLHESLTPLKSKDHNVSTLDVSGFAVGELPQGCRRMAAADCLRVAVTFPGVAGLCRSDERQELGLGLGSGGCRRWR
jgi:hypothetical protein